jgi:hypothetical protein
MRRPLPSRPIPPPRNRHQQTLRPTAAPGAPTMVGSIQSPVRAAAATVATQAHPLPIAAPIPAQPRPLRRVVLEATAISTAAMAETARMRPLRPVRPLHIQRQPRRPRLAGPAAMVRLLAAPPASQAGQPPMRRPLIRPVRQSQKQVVMAETAAAASQPPAAISRSPMPSAAKRLAER